MLYKKQIQVVKICYGGQGLSDEIIPLTEWMDEESGLKVFETYQETASKEGWYCDVKARERYVKASSM